MPSGPRSHGLARGSSARRRRPPPPVHIGGDDVDVWIVPRIRLGLRDAADPDRPGRVHAGAPHPRPETEVARAESHSFAPWAGPAPVERRGSGQPEPARLGPAAPADGPRPPERPARGGRARRLRVRRRHPPQHLDPVGAAADDGARRQPRLLLRQRRPDARPPAVLTAFSVLGGLLWAGLGLIQPLGLPVVVPVACALIFACSYARVWSVQAQSAGNVLVVVLCIALDRPLTPEQAAVTALMFAAGGLWATFLALVIWRLHPYRPAHRAVAEVWHNLARLCGDLERSSSCRNPTRPPSTATRGPPAGRAGEHRDRPDHDPRPSPAPASASRTAPPRPCCAWRAPSRSFSALIAVGELIDSRPDARRRALAKVFLRRLRPLLVTIARAIRDDVNLDLDRLEHSIARVAEGLSEDPTLARLAERIVGRVRIGAKLSTPEAIAPAARSRGGSLDRWTRYVGPLRQNFTLASPNLRTPCGRSAVAAPALAATLTYAGAFTHWLVMTVVLTMQPFYAATWQRALERIGGTVLGGLVGAVLAYYATSPLAEAGLILVLSIVGFAARQISYGFFVTCLTPLVVLLVELLEPGTAPGRSSPCGAASRCWAA